MAVIMRGAEWLNSGTRELGTIPGDMWLKTLSDIGYADFAILELPRPPLMSEEAFARGQHELEDAIRLLNEGSQARRAAEAARTALNDLFLGLGKRGFDKNAVAELLATTNPHPQVAGEVATIAEGLLKVFDGIAQITQSGRELLNRAAHAVKDPGKGQAISLRDAVNIDQGIAEYVVHQSLALLKFLFERMTAVTTP